MSKAAIVQRRGEGDNIKPNCAKESKEIGYLRQKYRMEQHARGKLTIYKRRRTKPNPSCQKFSTQTYGMPRRRAALLMRISKVVISTWNL